MTDLLDFGTSPYDGAVSRVTAAISANPKINLQWGHSRSRKQKDLTVPDLARCLIEIGAGDQVRVVVSRFSKTLRRKSGKVKQERVKTGHRNVGFTARRMGRLLGVSEKQARALMKTLLALGLIEIEKNYSTGRSGIVYRVVAEGKIAKPRPIPFRQSTGDADKLKPIDPNDNPFGKSDAPEGKASDIFGVTRDGKNIKEDFA